MLDPNPNHSADSMIGKLLVASTTVQDPVLARSVCLVVHQDTENVFAVLLNRPMTPPPGLVKMFNMHATEDSAPMHSNLSLPANEGPAKPTDDHPARDFSKSVNSFPTHLPGNSPASSQPQDEPSQQDKHSLVENTAAEAAKSLGTIHFGGPLSGPVVAVHNSSELAEAEAGKGVYVAAQRELIETLVRNRPGSYRLIVGHLGWSLGRLKSECDAGFWHMIDAIDEDVFSGDQELWPSVIRRATTSSLADWIGIANTPFAAEVN